MKMSKDTIMHVVVVMTDYSNGRQQLLGVLLNHKKFINRIFLRPLAMANFQNCTSVTAKLSFTYSENIFRAVQFTFAADRRSTSSYLYRAPLQAPWSDIIFILMSKCRFNTK
jgi:hypothetical protein